LVQFILTVGVLDDPFNLLLFLAGVSFLMSVTGHHHLSLIVYLNLSHPLPPPSFFSACAQPSFIIPAVCDPPPQSYSPYTYLAVFRYPL